MGFLRTVKTSTLRGLFRETCVVKLQRKPELLIQSARGWGVILGGMAAEERLLWHPQKFCVQSWGGSRFVTFIIIYI